MAAIDRAFVGNIPELYDRYLGPWLFEPYAEVMAQRLAGFDGELLELAAGTGIVTRALDRAIAPRARLTATDLNPPMLEHAAQKLRSQRVTWKQADAMALPFPDRSFDAAVCQFGAMFFPDRVASYREVRRVLRPGGRYHLSLWDRIEENPLAEAIANAVAAAFPADPPRFLQRTPYGYFDTRQIRADLQAAGFGDVELETVPVNARTTSTRDPALGLCQGSPLRGEIEARDPAGLERVTESAIRAAAHRFGEGPVEARIQAHLVVATA